MRKLFSLCLLLIFLFPVCVSAKEYEWAEGGDEPTMLDEVINQEQLKSYLEEFKKATDSRQVFNSASPEFLETYGKLFVDGLQLCTGNIVSNKPTNDSYIVTSSAHCFKTDNPQEISIVFLKRNGDEIERQLVLETLNRERDYAILRLDRKIDNSLIKPLVIAPYDHEDYDLGDFIYDVALIGFEPVLNVAGYSLDEYLGQSGKVLTYDQDCSCQGSRDFNTITDCTTYPGASGGGTVVSLDDTEFHFNYFVGVNKAGSFDPKGFLSDTYKGSTPATKPQQTHFVDIAVMYGDLLKALDCTKEDLYDIFEVTGY